MAILLCPKKKSFIVLLLEQQRQRHYLQNKKTLVLSIWDVHKWKLWTWEWLSVTMVYSWYQSQIKERYILSEAIEDHNGSRMVCAGSQCGDQLSDEGQPQVSRGGAWAVEQAGDRSFKVFVDPSYWVGPSWLPKQMFFIQKTRNKKAE